MMDKIRRAIMTPLGLMPKPESIEDITTIQPFTPTLDEDIVLADTHWSCASCYYLGMGRVCLKYDSPLPKNEHGDEVCWRQGGW